ncbi:MAG: hypothetical protein IBJ12_12215 [Sphingomonadaceae bacterium]|nr:hypothetical protein [Sphingomonadaceae bacterium]
MTTPKPIVPTANPLQQPVDYIKISNSEFEAMDISKFPVAGSGTGVGVDKGQSGKGMMGPGGGPGGATLYPVAWYREPFDSELAPYLAAVKRIPPGASAQIACQMIENYRVGNCQVLGEMPRGTGLAHALRRAAWQFLVRPPRINDKPQLGVWVRIRFDFRAKALEPDLAPE